MSYFSKFRTHPNVATGRVQFHVENMDLSVLNGIRRTLMTDVPTVGLVFEKGEGFFYTPEGVYEPFTVEPTLEVVVNTGPLHNEFLLHRMSMIPIYLSEDELDAYEPNSLMIEIEKTNHTTQTIPLTTHDIKLMKNNVVIPADTVRTVYFPKNAWSKEPILITRLRPGETIHLYGNFVKSTGRANAGMSPVSLCAYTPTMDAERVKQESIKGLLDRERAFLRNGFGDPIAWDFELEPECGLSAGYLIDKALEILGFKVRRARQTLMSDDLQVQAMEPTGTYEYAFMDEDDTLGHLIQGYIHNTYYRTGDLIDNRFRLSFVGYCCPHPLEAKMNVRLTFAPAEAHADITEDSITELTVRDFFKRCLTELEAHLADIRADWCRFTNRPVPAAEPVESKVVPEPTEETRPTEVVEPEVVPEPAEEPKPVEAVQPEGTKPEPKKRAPRKAKKEVA